MGINNPEILIPILDDLADNLQKWNYYASDTVNVSERIQVISISLLENYNHKVGLFKNIVEEDRHSINTLKNEIDTELNKCHLELDKTESLVQNIKSDLAEILNTLDYWEGELSNALEWLERAEEQLRIATINYENAQEAVRQAEKNLQDARDALRDCESSSETDSEGNEIEPDCSSLQDWVYTAEENLEQALRDLQIAKDELNEAKEEYYRAKERVALCKEAVKYSKEAKNNAVRAKELSLDALNFAERSLEEITASLKTIEKARQDVEKQENIIEDSEKKLNDAKSRYESAKKEEVNALSNYNSAQSMICNSVLELDTRTNSLRKFASGSNFHNKKTYNKETRKESTLGKIEEDNYHKYIKSLSSHAKFGKSFTADYKKTFFNNFPSLKGKVVVHHAVEQQVLDKSYKELISKEEMHSLENLRGIPKELNNVLHLRIIRKEWDSFYEVNGNPTKEQIIKKATEIDQKCGYFFKPQIRRN